MCIICVPMSNLLYASAHWAPSDRCTKPRSDIIQYSIERIKIINH